MSGYVFLARPVDQASPELKEQVRAQAVWSLLQRGLVTYDAGVAFSVPPGAECGDCIEKVNWQAMWRSNGVLAVLPEGVATIGVPMEIERAHHAGIPVAVVGPAGSWSLQFRNHDLYFYAGPWEKRATEGTLRVACDWLASMVAGQAGRDLQRERRTQILFQGDGRLPEKQHEGDAGFDLYYEGPDRYLHPDEGADLDCKLNVQMPEGTWGMLVGRSSTFRNLGLMVNVAVIDGGYRGPLMAIVRNISGHSQTVRHGDRIAQLVPMSRLTGMSARMVDELGPGDRDDRGFGSTGR